MVCCNHLRFANELTDEHWRTIGIRVKRLFALTLLMMAMLGLFAQEAAFAAGPIAALSQQETLSSSMDGDCMAAMTQGEEDEGAPCKGLTLDCIAKMGCAVPLAQVPSGNGSTIWPPLLPILTASVIAALLGRNEAPIPEPPTILG